ncbi:hypothetical protein [Leucobacter sp.]
MTSTTNPTAAIHELVDVLTEQRNEAQRQALMHEDRAEADRLLALVRRVSETDQARLTHGIMLVPGEQYAKLRDAHDNADRVRGDLNEARSERDWWRDEARSAAIRPGVTASFERKPRNLRGEQLLDLIETIKETGGTVEVHGVKIQRCDERGQTY